MINQLSHVSLLRYWNPCFLYLAVIWLDEGHWYLVLNCAICIFYFYLISKSSGNKTIKQIAYAESQIPENWNLWNCFAPKTTWSILDGIYQSCLLIAHQMIVIRQSVKVVLQMHLQWIKGFSNNYHSLSFPYQIYREKLQVETILKPALLFIQYMLKIMVDMIMNNSFTYNGNNR